MTNLVRYAWVVSFLIALVASPAGAVTTGLGGYQASEYFVNETAQTAGLSLVSFDWDANGDLYTLAGSYAPVQTVYKHTGSTTAELATEYGYPGSMLKTFGDYVYFNDGGSGSRYTADYYRYGTQNGGLPTKVVNSATTGTNWWSFDSNGTYAVGFGGDFNNQHLTILPMAFDATAATQIDDATGMLGNAGPVLFDNEGNLFVGNSTSLQIFRFSAAEVATAIADPGSAALVFDETHTWVANWSTLGAVSGTSGMTIDTDGNLLVSCTSWTAPSELVKFEMGSDGSFLNATTIAQSEGRMDTVRVYGGMIYLSENNGANDSAIYSLSSVPEPSTMALLACGVLAIAGYLGRRRVSAR